LACEILDPFLTPYFEDLISYAVIGARTTTSMHHRIHSSYLEAPVGIKNSLYGSIEDALLGCLVAKQPHISFQANEKGTIEKRKSQGNPSPHIILRGSKDKANFDLLSIQSAKRLMQKHHYHFPIMVDCSHGNSRNNFQTDVFHKTIENMLQEPIIKGVLIESYLHEGNQPLEKPLKFGISITDSCLSFKQTKQMILEAQKILKNQSSDSSISSVQSCCFQTSNTTP
ncbi:MAG TPA: hypothetical protein P5048_04800, partial [Chlamydiales bacterium]|nr:hypothetical protein [Chlamydiales bacterium]